MGLKFLIGPEIVLVWTHKYMRLGRRYSLSDSGKIWMGTIGILACFFVWAGTASTQTLFPGEGSADSIIPKEPGWKAPSYRGWELMSVNGMISTFYDLDLDGALDYMVIRKVVRKASSEELAIDQAIEIARYDKLSVYISNPVIYFANRYPMFYCLGVDFRRNCQKIWADVQEDGLNGNEVAYSLSTPKLPVR